MPKIAGDFSEIAIGGEQLPDGDYRFRLTEIEEQAPQANKNTAIIFKSEVTEGPLAKRQFWDFVYLVKNDDTPNSLGLGRIKAYAAAILGDEKANDKEGIDTDELKGGEFLGVIKARTYEARDGSGEKVSADLKRVLPV